MINNNREKFLIASTNLHADYAQIYQIFESTFLAHLK